MAGRRIVPGTGAPHDGSGTGPVREEGPPDRAGPRSSGTGTAVTASRRGRPAAPLVRTVPGERLPPYYDGVREVYADAFGSPPWEEDPAMADAYLDRLASDAGRPGFTAALAVDGGAVLGFAVAWTTPSPFPRERCYPHVAAALGPERTDDWLCGAREVDELAVRREARGLGLGAALLDAVTAGAPEGRSWLLTAARAGAAAGFYRRLGWHQATHPGADRRGVIAFLGPRHPGGLPS